MMDETKKVFSKYPLLTISFVALLSLTLVFYNILVGDTVRLKNQSRNIDNWANAHFYTLTDSIAPEEELAFWNMPDCIQRMKDAVEQFENSEYNYCIFTHQSICATNLKLPDEFYYYLPRSEKGMPLYSEGLLDTYQVNQKTWNLFDLQVEVGQGFQTADYSYGSIIPVVVGSEYQDFLSVGSTIDCYYLEQKLTMEVVGVLRKDSMIFRQGSLESLDWSIVMPSLRLDNSLNVDLSPTTEIGRLFRKIYIQKLSGSFALSNQADLSSLMLYVNDILAEYGIFKHEFLAMPREGITLFANISNQYVGAKYLWNLAMFSLLILCFSRYVSLIFRRNARRYAILVISGASHAQILRVVMASTISFVMVANIMAFAITTLFIGISYNMVLCIFSVLFDAVISACMLRKYIQTSDGLIAYLDNE